MRFAAEVSELGIPCTACAFDNCSDEAQLDFKEEMRSSKSCNLGMKVIRIDDNLQFGRNISDFGVEFTHRLQVYGRLAFVVSFL